jgi:two-component system LytT family response regulator
LIGRIVAQYRIDAEIGRGGMGVVYRARDLRLERDVAIKVVSPELTRDDDFRRRLVREAQAAARLAHPAVCVIHAVEEVEGTALIAMELIRGEALSRRLADGGALAPEAALELAVELAEALAEAHDCEVVHRDLKPGNVMLTDSGRAKIIDFGLAQHTPARRPLDSGADTPARALGGELIGTAAYMSPEQAAGRPVDRRTDIFSLGTLLCELLTGRSPFLRENAVETLHAVLKEPAPPVPAGLLGGAAPAVQRVLDRCLAKSATDRYATARELLVDLRAARRELGHGPAAAAAAPGPLRVLIVDDEAPARALLREYLEASPDCQLAGECRNGFEAVKAVAAEQPDVVLLDVQMPKLNGFEVAELLGDDVPVIFVTAYDEHAVKAFEVNAVDYLLKPVSAERFAAALERVRARAGRQPAAPIAQVVAAARPEPRRALDRILVRDGAAVHVLPVDQIDYAQGRDDYVGLHTGGRELLKQQRLAELEESLDPSRFVRIHRSYLLNVDRLSRLETEERDRRVAVLTDGTRLPISRSGYARLRELL